MYLVFIYLFHRFSYHLSLVFCWLPQIDVHPLISIHVTSRTVGYGHILGTISANNFINTITVEVCDSQCMTKLIVAIDHAALPFSARLWGLDAYKSPAVAHGRARMQQ